MWWSCRCWYQGAVDTGLGVAGAAVNKVVLIKSMEKSIRLLACRRGPWRRPLSDEEVRVAMDPAGDTLDDRLSVCGVTMFIMFIKHASMKYS